SEDEIWQLYGWLGQRDGKLLPPQVMQQTALQIGTAILNREAHLFFSRIGFNQEKTFRLATLWVQDGDPQMDYQLGLLTLNDFSG
ncbi:hypothetical protein MJI47_29325, partial [Salmonella enterica subsp. enterica serovar Kentucky]|nr:hypothetical protein [Salmonella enterica subsp. enterica serovar Kentucky]